MKRRTPRNHGVRPEPIDRVLHPFHEFAHAEASGGIVLVACAAIALVWANSPWRDAYFDLWHTELALALGEFRLAKQLHHWINDALMVVFFFVVGLEIKREMLVGELASVRKAALPMAAALGGMVVPAAIYAALNYRTEGSAGWGIPMATDIAFALGVLALVGKGIPTAGRVFLTALAIVDDIGATLVIALFYTDEISWLHLGLAGGVLLLMAGANRLGVRAPLVYLLMGVALWIAMLRSGVHPTIAGVLSAFTIPARTRIDERAFVEKARSQVDEFQRGRPSAGKLASPQQMSAVHELEEACEQAQAPLQRLEDGLHPWVIFFIMPVFALANAGVELGATGGTLTGTVSLGVIAGLVIGKPLGITALAWLAVRSRIAVLPDGVSWRHVVGLGMLGGIGFTMSLFIANLAFAGTELRDAAKMGILTASVIAGLAGWLFLCGSAPRTQQE